MAEIDRFQPGDRAGVEALFRRVFGHDAASASQLRWRWQYALNPNTPPEGPSILVAREGPTIVAQQASMPVTLSAAGHEWRAGWATDLMVAPERRRQGIGERLFRAFDRSVDAALGLGVLPASRPLMQKLRWPYLETVPCLVKPLTRRALRQPRWPMALNRLVSAATLPIVRLVSRVRPLAAQIEPIRHFDGRFDELWDRLAPRFDLAVRRDAAYLNWKFIEPPHVRYTVVALKRGETVGGYAAYRHVREPLGRVTLLVDFLADPDDAEGLSTLFRWVDRETRAADSDKIRVFATHAGFRKALRRSGYFTVKSSLQLGVRLDAQSVTPDFYRDTSRWHITLGDADLDPPPVAPARTSGAVPVA
jgi:GNAT superfamily N-acetyltransferase